MDRFTYDVESTVLSTDVLNAYAETVRFLAHAQLQHELSEKLARNKSKLGSCDQDRFQRRARQMWRTEVRA